MWDREVRHPITPDFRITHLEEFGPKAFRRLSRGVSGERLSTGCRSLSRPSYEYSIRRNAVAEYGARLVSIGQYERGIALLREASGSYTLPLIVMLFLVLLGRAILWLLPEPSKQALKT